jgi:hypothetical protein
MFYSRNVFTWIIIASAALMLVYLLIRPRPRPAKLNADEPKEWMANILKKKDEGDLGNNSDAFPKNKKGKKDMEVEKAPKPKKDKAKKANKKTNVFNNTTNV